MVKNGGSARKGQSVQLNDEGGAFGVDPVDRNAGNALDRRDALLEVEELADLDLNLQLPRAARHGRGSGAVGSAHRGAALALHGAGSEAVEPFHDVLQSPERGFVLLTQPHQWSDELRGLVLQARRHAGQWEGSHSGQKIADCYIGVTFGDPLFEIGETVEQDLIIFAQLVVATAEASRSNSYPRGLSSGPPLGHRQSRLDMPLPRDGATTGPGDAAVRSATRDRSRTGTPPSSR